MADKITVTGLTKTFGTRSVLNGLSFAVQEGSICGFLGNNGAGKTTTLSILAGLLSPTSGEVLLLGEPMAKDKAELRGRIGTVFDSENLFENLTLDEHLAFSARVFGVNAGDIKARSDELVSLLGLKDARHRRIKVYSHGMKKKAALACALIHDPEVLLLDEPFEGVDAGSISAIKQNLRALSRRGRTVFVTSHILPLVDSLCDRVIIIDQGKVVLDSRLVDMQVRWGSGNQTLEDLFLKMTESENLERTLSWNQ